MSFTFLKKNGHNLVYDGFSFNIIKVLKNGILAHYRQSYKKT